LELKGIEMKIVFLLICVFLALAGVAGLPAPLLARKFAGDQILKKNGQKNTRGMRYLRYEDETNVRLTKRSPVAPLVELTSELLAKRSEDEGDARLTKRSPVAPLVELTSELLAKRYEDEGDARLTKRQVSPTLTRRKRDDFDLAEAEADPRKKRSPEGDARKKLAAEAEADPRKKRSPFEVASESDIESRVSVRETEAYP